jgi:serine protease Do
MVSLPRPASAASIVRGTLFAMLLGLAAANFGVTAPAAARPAPDSFADLATAVSDAVVNISATEIYEEKDAGNGSDVDPGTPFDDLFDKFLRGHPRGGSDSDTGNMRERSSNSLGSGFVIDPSGIIITNYHVISDSNEVTVIFTDGTKLHAKVIGKDSKVDVAVLKVKSDHPLKAVKFGDSDKMRVGDWVMAVGNPFGLGGTVTAGIVSARHRDIESGPYDDYIQTDASINKGNSGGPLFNMDGEVIGINTAILSPSGGSIGIGFATPSNTVAPIIDQLRAYGETRRGWLGVRIQSIDDSIAESLGLGKVRGALVAGTDPRGPAAEAGIETGDVIVKFDGEEVAESHDLPKLVGSTAVGKVVQIVIVRQGHEMAKLVTLGRLEDGQQNASLTVSDLSQGKKLIPSRIEKVLGMALSTLDETSRLKYAIKDSVSAGVVVTGVDPNSPAAQKNILPGEVILEINQEPVHAATDVTKKMSALKNAGKKLALLLVSTPQGEVRFVAINL